MAKKVKQKHGGELNILGKGETANPNGRPRKWVTTLKDQGYKVSEINDTLQVLLSMTLTEIQEVYANPQATVLEKVVARTIVKAIGKGSLSEIETILSRVFGKPFTPIGGKNGGPISIVPVVQVVNNETAAALAKIAEAGKKGRK